MHDRALPNDEAALVKVITRLSAHDPMLVIVDQPASIGPLPIAVARWLSIEVAYLPGLSMRRIADLHSGQAKTDAHDAYVIADAAAPFPVPCVGSAPTTRPSPSWPCWQATTTTSPPSPPGSVTR